MVDLIDLGYHPGRFGWWVGDGLEPHFFEQKKNLKMFFSEGLFDSVLVFDKNWETNQNKKQLIQGNQKET